ncbi:MAG: thymidine kinase [Lachnospiraceae bacterium]|nr:thymidine kinase [Lachnospiraceae bacterium]
MAKLIFRYGAMGASKTANALMVQFNYQERGMKAIILKPEIECRDGKNVIRSRIGLSAECQAVEEFIKSPDKLKDLSAIIVDEVQFLSKEMIDKLAEIVDNQDIPVICYGLKTNFRGELFKGSKRLLELADIIEEIPTICWCGRKARFNARIIDGKVVTDGPEVVMGGNESYISLCRKHYMEKKLS